MRPACWNPAWRRPFEDSRKEALDCTRGEVELPFLPHFLVAGFVFIALCMGCWSLVILFFCLIGEDSRIQAAQRGGVAPPAKTGQDKGPYNLTCISDELDSLELVSAASYPTAGGASFLVGSPCPGESKEAQRSTRRSKLGVRRDGPLAVFLRKQQQSVGIFLCCLWYQVGQCDLQCWVDSARQGLRLGDTGLAECAQLTTPASRALESQIPEEANPGQGPKGEGLREGSREGQGQRQWWSAGLWQGCNCQHRLPDLRLRPQQVYPGSRQRDLRPPLQIGRPWKSFCKP